MNAAVSIVLTERAETVHASEEDESSLLSKRLTLTLGAYVEGKFKQWDVELKDVNQTFSKSIKRSVVTTFAQSFPSV